MVKMRKAIIGTVAGLALFAGGWAFADTSVGPTAAYVTMVEGSTTYSSIFANGYDSNDNVYFSDTISCPSGTSFLAGHVSAPGAGSLEGVPSLRPATYDTTTGFTTGVHIQLYSDDNGTGTITYYVECITLPS
jgi:hypothetical protein